MFINFHNNGLDQNNKLKSIDEYWQCSPSGFHTHLPHFKLHVTGNIRYYVGDNELYQEAGVLKRECDQPPEVIILIILWRNMVSLPLKATLLNTLNEWKLNGWKINDSTNLDIIFFNIPIKCKQYFYSPFRKKSPCRNKLARIKRFAVF